MRQRKENYILQNKVDKADDNEKVNTSNKYQTVKKSSTKINTNRKLGKKLKRIIIIYYIIVLMKIIILVRNLSQIMNSYTALCEMKLKYCKIIYAMSCLV